MKRWIVSGIIAVGLVISIFGVPPFSGHPTSGYEQGEPGFQSEVRRLPNGIFEVSALTPMPGVTPEMVRWWFADYLQTSEHYQRWYPGAHVWMDWENKIPGEYIGASHLVHEYIGDDLNKLRIQFVSVEEVLGDVELSDGSIAICAKAGLLEQPLNGGKMCHIIRKTTDGAEMRSRFWLGIVAKRDGNSQVGSVEGLVGNTYLARRFGISRSDAIDLMNHCAEEMKILAEFLPDLYAQEVKTS